MAWRNIGAVVYLAPGKSITWSYSWPKGEDHGVQIAAADLKAAPGALGTVVASNQGIGTIGINAVFYVVTTTEVSGTQGAIFNLQGGGLT